MLNLLFDMPIAYSICIFISCHIATHDSPGQRFTPVTGKQMFYPTSGHHSKNVIIWQCMTALKSHDL